MMLINFWSTSWLVALALATTPPSQDPFYNAPTGFEKAAPGTILRQRAPPTPLSFLGVAPLNINASFQLQFRTQDNDGNPATAVSTLIIPHNADYTKLLSFEAAIDASCVDCAPSYTLQQLPNPQTAISQAEFLSIEATLNRGWCVTIPDFEGSKAAWLARRLTAYVVLDNIRATLKSTQFSQVSPSARVTLWGYSGGGIASGVAAELHSSYAPELEIAGAVLGGPTPNIANAISAINKGTFSGVSVGALWGLANAYPVVDSTIQAHLLPATADNFNYSRDHYCLLTNLLDFTLQDVVIGYFDINIIQEPNIARVLADNNMGHVAPKTPIYVYQAINNELSPIEDTDLLVSQYCAGGSNVQYLRDVFSEHVVLLATGAPSAVLWLQDRFDGKPVTPGCTTQNVSSTLLSPEALAVFGKSTVQTLLDLIGRPIGPASFA